MVTVNSLQVTIYTTAYTAQSLSWSKPFSGIKILSSSYPIKLGCTVGWGWVGWGGIWRRKEWGVNVMGLGVSIWQIEMAWNYTLVMLVQSS